MPWMTDSVVAQRARFVRAYQSGQWTMTELCGQVGISRPTGYKWIARAAAGADGLLDRAPVPQACPHRTPSDTEALLVEARRRYGWGASKVLTVLAARDPRRAWPVRSTVNEIFERHGLLKKRRRHRRWPGQDAEGVVSQAPNDVWPADFKGQFKTADGIYCYPLTVTDHFSRAVLLCRALPSTRVSDVQPAFLALFREVGLPAAIRTDNGSPFASTGIHGLTTLNVWWMTLGIVHQRIRRGYPQANGTHERMHRELKRETAQPPASTARGQQRRFDRFRQRYNEERPHEGIAQRTPATLWRPSRRPYPRRIAAPDYPRDFETRRVKSGGTFWFHGRLLFLSNALEGHDVGLQAIEDGVWNLVFYRTVLGRLHEERGEIIGL
jgi:transposase InsO family protein